jgi:hypothetical protein
MMPTTSPSLPARGRSVPAKPPGRAAAGARPVTVSRAGYAFMLVLLTIVFEGAVRKWLTAGATAPLLLLRDVTAVCLVLYAWRGGFLQRHPKITTVMVAWTCCVIIWSLLQVMLGQNSPIVLAIGLRFWLLYTWFAVAAAATMNEADYRVSIRLVALIMIVLAPLAVMQHYSAQGSTINRQVDGDEESVFVVVEGVVRTTGTFSFTSGYAAFILLAAPLILGFLGAFKHKRMQWVFALTVFAALLMGTVVSGSRTAVLSAGGLLAVYIGGRIMFARGRDKAKALIAAFMAAGLLGAFVYFFSDAVSVTQERFETAAGSENLFDRILIVFFGEPTVMSDFTWLGGGLGAGSNVATSLRAGAENFGLSESEAGRILLEGGLLGFAYIALKLVVVAVALLYCWRLSRRTHSAFPILMGVTLLLGVFTWPTIGQLSANGMLGLLLTFFLLMCKYPTAELFVRKRR